MSGRLRGSTSLMRSAGTSAAAPGTSMGNIATATKPWPKPEARQSERAESS